MESSAGEAPAARIAARAICARNGTCCRSLPRLFGVLRSDRQLHSFPGRGSHDVLSAVRRPDLIARLMKLYDFPGTVLDV